jgi:hypothetical protein
MISTMELICNFLKDSIVITKSTSAKYLTYDVRISFQTMFFV